MSTTAPFEATPPLSDQTNLINQLKEERTKLEQLQAQFEIQQLRAQLKLQEDQMKLREDQLALQAQGATTGTPTTRARTSKG
jgi:multidrug efflux pump subunit AcrA (membrane-fusion protein)